MPTEGRPGRPVRACTGLPYAPLAATESQIHRLASLFANSSQRIGAHRPYCRQRRSCTRNDGKHQRDHQQGKRIGRAHSVTLGAFGIAAAASIVLLILTARNSLVVMLISPDLALTSGIHVQRLNFLYLEAFALTIALGLHYLGVLLMGALIIVPAVTARLLARSLREMLFYAVGLAIVAALAGSFLASHFRREPGPLIALVAAFEFLLSPLLRK